MLLYLYHEKMLLSMLQEATLATASFSLSSASQKQNTAPSFSAGSCTQPELQSATLTNCTNINQ